MEVVPVTFHIRGKKYSLEAVFLILPLLILFLITIIYPVMNLVYTSFFEWNGIKSVPYTFVGLDNYISFFKDHQTPVIFKNVLVMICTGIFGTIPIAFFLATVINKTFKGLRFFRTCYFLPVVINRVAVCLMFTFIFFPRTGPLALLQRALGAMNASGVLTNPNTAMWAIAFVNMWCNVGFQMIVFSSGMAAIPNELYEAAALDGVTPFQRLWRITIPMMKSTIKVVCVFVLTGSFKVFDIVRAMTDGAPGGATEVLNTVLYRNAFVYNRYGQADAIAVIILLICLGISTFVNMVFKNKD